MEGHERHTSQEHNRDNRERENVSGMSVTNGGNCHLADRQHVEAKAPLSGALQPSRDDAMELLRIFPSLFLIFIRQLNDALGRFG